MRSVATRRRVAHSAAEMFALVADVERYAEFVPLCRALRVLGRRRSGRAEIITARMTVAYGPISESFGSTVVLDRDASRIDAKVEGDGPFRQLDNRWVFSDLPDGGCEVDFRIDYALKSLALQLVVGAAFDRIYGRMVEAFEARAIAVHGPRRGSAGDPIGETQGGEHGKPTHL